MTDTPRTDLCIDEMSFYVERLLADNADLRLKHQVACETIARMRNEEIEPKYFDIACERITNAYRQERLFA